MKKSTIKPTTNYNIYCEQSASERFMFECQNNAKHILAVGFPIEMLNLDSLKYEKSGKVKYRVNRADSKYYLSIADIVIDLGTKADFDANAKEWCERMNKRYNKKGKYNRGHYFERAIYKALGKQWRYDNSEYYTKGDLYLDGIRYQLKSNNGELWNTAK